MAIENNFFRQKFIPPSTCAAHHLIEQVILQPRFDIEAKDYLELISSRCNHPLVPRRRRALSLKLRDLFRAQKVDRALWQLQF